MDKFIKLENSNHGTKTNNYGDQSEVIAVCKNKTEKINQLRAGLNDHNNDSSKKKLKFADSTIIKLTIVTHGGSQLTNLHLNSGQRLFSTHRLAFINLFVEQTIDTETFRKREDYFL